MRRDVASSGEARPMPVRLKVLFVTSECAPFARTGGLGEVVGALPKALHRHGLDIRVIMPLYAGISWQQFEPLQRRPSLPLCSAPLRVHPGRLSGSGVPIYFLEHHRYFDRPHLYGPPPEAYPDNLERFAFLSRAALELVKALGWIPDVIHANDWQTALIPIYVNT